MRGVALHCEKRLPTAACAFRPDKAYSLPGIHLVPRIYYDTWCPSNRACAKCRYHPGIHTASKTRLYGIVYNRRRPQRQ